MADIKKVIRGLTHCIKRNPDDKPRCRLCPYTHNCVNRMHLDALDLLKERDWISVKDELPRTGRSVLVYVRRDDGVDTWYRTIAWMGEKNWDSCDPYFSQKDTITHWMSLPEPPKGEDE